MGNRFPYQAMLFDLDGTLIDTAPDMANALNLLLRQEGGEPLPFEEIRPHVSYGSTAMIKRAFGAVLEAAYYNELRRRFLQLYEDNIYHHTTLFPGIGELLDMLDDAGMPWGIVTNKPAYLTHKLLETMGLMQRARSVVSGDTLAVKKPDPEPMLLAASQCGCTALQCMYLGDASRDIEAGRNAGMDSYAAGYGYLQQGDNPHEWNARGVFECPEQVLDWYLQKKAGLV